MTNLPDLLKAAESEAVGFKVKEALALEITSDNSVNDCQSLAESLFGDQRYQIRELSVFILGNIAHQSNQALVFLKNTVSQDTNWRVQEILAKAFDRFCLNTGYENSLPHIQEWLTSDLANTRRAVTEGLRIWTSRDYFKQHPSVAINLLTSLKNDPSDYVRKSVGSAIRDISRRQAALVERELAAWDLSNPAIRQVHHLAAKFLGKSN